MQVATFSRYSLMILLKSNTQGFAVVGTTIQGSNKTLNGLHITAKANYPTIFKGK